MLTVGAATSNLTKVYKKILAGINFNLSRAFDYLQFDLILIDKLSAYGVRRLLLGLSFQL